jgi:hypothetical protein
MTPEEIRLRCIEAAARTPTPHADGYTAGVLEAAKKYADWVTDEKFVPPLIGMPAAKLGEGVDSLF